MRITASDLAWMKGEGSHAKGDTFLDGMRKAEEQGYKPSSEGYIPFLAGFLNIANSEAPIQPTSA